MAQRALIICLALLTVSAALAEATLSAQVDSEIVTMDDVVQLTVSVSGGGGHPQLPSLKGFRIVATSTQQSMSIINTSVQSSTDYLYELQPLRTGNLTIGPVTLGGQSTEPITITVTPGMPGGSGMNHPLVPQSANPFAPGPVQSIAPGEAAQVRHSVDHKTAYVGQQITYTFSFYQAEQLYGEVQYNPAETPGFVAESLPNPPQGTESLNGRPYQVQRRQKALFATSPGKHVIGQTSVSVATDPFSGPHDLIAKALTINVLPLPAAGQPANFTGAVGSFAVTLSVDRQAVRAGETVNCTVQVRGIGNVRSLGAPQLKLPDWVRVYKTPEKRTLSPGGGGGALSVMGGVATFPYMLLPKQAGTLTLPSLEYPYFDPKTGTYRVAHSQPVQIVVAPGTGVVTEQPPTATGDLQPLEQRQGRPLTVPLALRPAFWVLSALPLLLVGWAGWQRWQQVRLVADPLQARAGSALTLARRRFDGACRALEQGDQDGCYAALNAALADYIADRTGAPPSGLTAETACELLRQFGAEEASAWQAHDLLSRTAAGRFAPGGATPEAATRLAEECRELVNELQRQVRPS